MTLAEKILVDHSGSKSVHPGDTLFVRPDLAVGSEIIFPQVKRFLERLGLKRLDRQDRAAFVNGHLVPTKDAAVGTLVAALDEFAHEQQVSNYYQVGRSGQCQTLIATQNLIRPGEFVIGSDQHMTTYGALGALATGVGGLDLAAVWATGATWMTVPESSRIRLHGRLRNYVTAKDLALHLLWKLGPDGMSGMAVEFGGDAIGSLDMSARFTLCNMMVETGAKFVYFPVDEITTGYMRGAGFSDMPIMTPSYDDSEFTEEIEFDLANVAPMAASPYNPTNGIPARLVGEVNVDQVVIGGCTNGSIQDFRLANKIVGRYGKNHHVRLGLYPTSYQVVREMIDEGLVLGFTALGAQIAPPSCQPCLGSGPSLIGEEEVGIYTTNRNFRGRHGPDSAKVYLAGPLVAAASAVTGFITDPRDL